MSDKVWIFQDLHVLKLLDVIGRVISCLTVTVLKMILEYQWLAIYFYSDILNLLDFSKGNL